MASVVRTLLVEDSPAIREDMLAQLKKIGIEAHAAENGAVAWLWLQKVKNDAAKRPELIVSDVNMPEMDGLQLLEKVRSEAAYAETPFIITTSNKEELLRMTALCLNVTAFYIKPPNMEQFLKQLAKTFPTKKLTK